MSTTRQRYALVVDDDVSVRTMIQRFCDARGWLASAASCLAEARAALDAHPRLVVVDLALGKETGWEVIRLASARGSAVVVVSGGDLDDDTRADAKLLGASAMLGKPFTEREFWAAVNRALSSA